MIVSGSADSPRDGRSHSIARQFHVVVATAAILVLAACSVVSRSPVSGTLVISQGRRVTPDLLIGLLNRMYHDAPEETFDKDFGTRTERLAKFAVAHLTHAQLAEFEVLLLNYSSDLEPSARTTLLTTTYKTLQGEPASRFGLMLRQELCAIVLRDRLDAKVELPDVFRPAAAPPSVSPYFFEACAKALLNGASTEDDRYHNYEAICAICYFATPTGRLYKEVLFPRSTTSTDVSEIATHPELKRGLLYEVRSFDSVHVSESSGAVQYRYDTIALEVGELDRWIIQKYQNWLTMERLNAVESRIGKLESVTKELQSWQAAVNAHLDRIDAALEAQDRDIEQLYTTRPGHPLVRRGKPNDLDGDGIPDDVEDALLRDFAPVWKTDDKDGDWPPLPIEWYVRHCRIAWYDQEYNGKTNPGRHLGDTGDEALSCEFVNGQFYERYFPLGLAPNTFLRLEFKNPERAFERGQDPLDMRTWSTAQERQDCLYGRCAKSNDGKSYRVQYFLFFGYNDCDETRNVLSCPFGNHDGDVVCVEFIVDITTKKATRAVYHDHGRQIFVDGAAIPMEKRDGNDHPVVYLEKGNHEALPWGGTEGFRRGSVPAGIKTNKIFHAKKYFGYAFGGETGPDSGDAPAVRLHLGRGFQLYITNVKNVGEFAHPYPNAEARFIMTFRGKYGREGYDGCDILTIWQNFDNVDSPEGPPYQPKMWNDDFSTALDDSWPGPK